MSRVGSVLSLYAQGALQSRVDLARPGSLQAPYLRWMAAAIHGYSTFRKSPNAIHIGGGLAALPLYLSGTNTRLRQHVFEIDSDVISAIPRELFATEKIRLTHGDGREGINAKQPSTCDLIITDAIDMFGGSIALVSSEFFADCARSLAPGGLLLTNVASLPTEHVERVARGIRHHFRYVGSIMDPRRKSPTGIENVVLFATNLSSVLEAVASGLWDKVPEVVVSSSIAEAADYSESRGDRVSSKVDCGWLNQRLRELRVMIAVSKPEDSYQSDFHIVYSQLQEVQEQYCKGEAAGMLH